MPDVPTVFEALYRDSVGYAQILCGHYEGGKLVVDSTTYFQQPEQLEEMAAFAAANKDFDVYHSVCLLSDKRRSTETATVTNAVYVDADTCHPDNFLVAPSIVVTTSPGSYQCYWTLDQEITADHAAQLAHRICIKHEDQGCDPSGWIEAKLLRTPGSTHGKTDVEYTVTEENFGTLYSVEDIAVPYADVEIPVTVTVNTTPIPTDLPMVSEVAGRMSADTFGLYNHTPGDNEDWSSLRWRLALDLFREGFDATEVFVAVKHSRFNKYAPNDKKAADPRGDGGLWQEILKAQSTHTTEAHPPAVLEEETSREILFLTDEERDSIEPCFVDQFQTWVTKRSPLHAPKYSRFLSLFLLANVYGGWAYIAPQPGNMDLNLWGLLLGPSSTTKKTTVLNLTRTVLKAWEGRIPEEDRGIDIGSDFTAEGLNAKLAERDGKVSFIHRDEVSGFFKEAFTKNYLAGTIERLTALYEGEVLMTMRASTHASQGKNARATLNMIGMGIEQHTAEVLSTRQFISGFLPRYLWCVADAPAWQPEHERVGQRSDDEVVSSAREDVEVTEFCNQFSKARRKWGIGDKKAILLADDALERINQFALDTKYLITSMEGEEILEPSRARMMWSVWKVAALLAIHDRADRIEMKHLLYALREAETWFADLIRMSKAVASSEFEGQVNAVEQFVASAKSGVHPSRIYRKFSNIRTGEIDEYLRALVLQGRIMRGKEGTYLVND